MLGDRVIFPQQDSRTAAEMCRVPVVYGRPPSMPPFGTSPSPLSWIDTTVHIPELRNILRIRMATLDCAESSA